MSLPDGVEPIPGSDQGIRSRAKAAPWSPESLRVRAVVAAQAKASAARWRRAGDHNALVALVVALPSSPLAPTGSTADVPP